MQENKIMAKSKDRFHRRKGSKSPINIRLKIRELEEKMQKNHRASHKYIVVARRTPSPQKMNGAVQGRQGMGQKGQNNGRGARQELKKCDKVGPKINNQTPANNKIIQVRPPNKISSPQSPIHYSPTNGILRIKSQQCRRRPAPVQNSQEDLLKLKQKNQKYREVYNKSLQKMKALQHELQELRENYANEKHNWKETCEMLEFKAEARKVPLAHIYSYENRPNLMIGADKIITEQDNENSSMRDQGLLRSSLIGLSMLTHPSHQT